MTNEERLKIFEEVETGCVTDALIAYGIGSWMSGIFPASPNAKIYGRAVTAYFDIVTPPREPITVYEIIEQGEPGDVMVWNADIDANIMGENIMNFILNHKLSGVVIEGKVRDFGQICELGGAVFSRGPAVGSAPTNFRATWDTVNVPVTVGGAVINPGDYICGDIDGVMVIPKDGVDDVLLQAKCNMDWEAELAKAIKSGYSAEQMKAVYKTQKILPRSK
ncbi:MAG: RraA family protein [Oscillospiraceae bacterium]